MTRKTPNLDNWPVRNRTNTLGKVPIGYMVDPEDPHRLLPNPDAIALIERTLDDLDGGRSYRDAAAWLTQNGVGVSHQTICNIWKRLRSHKRSGKMKQLRDRARATAPKTPEERAAQKARNKVRAAKRSQAVQERKIAALTGSEKAALPDAIPFSDTLDHEASPPAAEIIFKPNPGPQTEFLAAPEREVLYGGAAGGGKSYGLLADPMRYFTHPQFMGLILRRTSDELRELIWKSQELYPRAFPGAVWREKKSQWEFPDGGRLWMTYLERDEDVLRYQGQAFSYVAFDELTQYATPFAWNYMRSRLRTTAADLPIFQRATTNPGGPGHGWVKRMFIDPAPYGKPFPATDIDTGEVLRYPDSHSRAGKPLFYRRFIPARLADNPYLMEGGDYEANLLSLPEMQRRQLLDGDWNVASGAAFPEFRLSLHVCEPFDIPPDWRRFRSCDYGYSSYSAVHWFAIDPAYGTLYGYRELYVSKHTAKALALAILEAEERERIDYGVLDSSCWHQRGQTGPSIAEEMIMEGCRWRPSDRTAGARVNGKNRFHEVLKVDPETGKPGIIFFDTCRQIIADLPVIPSDPKGGDDIDSRYQSDHAYDSVRYGIMSRPRPRSIFEEWGNQSRHQPWRPANSTFGY